jgi:hypothetical protein
MLVACCTLLGAVQAIGRAAELDEPNIGARGHDPDARWGLDTSFAGRSYSIRYLSAGNPELSRLAERLRADPDRLPGAGAR